MKHRRWTRISAGACAAALLGVPAAAGGAPTNYELVRDAAHAACAQLTQGLRTAGTDSVLGIRGVGTSTGNFLVENTLSSALTEAGWSVRTRPDSSVARIVEFDVVDLGLTYPRVHRSAWFGDRKVEREARARVFARLVDTSRGHILWADQAEARRRDEVPAARLTELEEKNPADYARATLPPERWNKFVEPVVVTGIIAGLIVLFFSNQSTN